MQAKIMKWGNSHGIRLSKYLLENANLSNNDNVDIVVEDGSIVIKKARTFSTIEERFEEYDGGSFKTELTDMGGPIGAERWWENE